MDDFAHIIRYLQEQIEPLVEQGQIDDALAILNQALADNAEDAHCRAGILELRGAIYYEADQLEMALDDFQQAVAELSAGVDDFELAGSIHTSIGACHHALGQLPETVQNWQLATQYYESNDPPLLVDVATIANNLGFLYKGVNDLDSAENCFLRALKIMHGEFGQYDEQTATIYCNLGLLYHQAGFYDQSREMHEVALTTRSKMLGRAHPDTAQSHNNMGLTLMAAGEYEEAQGHFDAAMKSFAALGANYAEDFEAARDNYVELLREVGEYDKAEEIEARAL